MRRLQLRSCFFFHLTNEMNVNEIKVNKRKCHILCAVSLKEVRESHTAARILKALNNFMATNTGSYAY